MGSAVGSIENIRTRILTLESELLDLRHQLAIAEDLAHENVPPIPCELLQCNDKEIPATIDWRWPLAAEEYSRYGRQMILPEIGLQGQLNLRNASVLVVGLGGLGCPAAIYLAGAGVGTIGLLDGDTVEVSNLHRQILHTTNRIGYLKVNSARESLRQLNSMIRYIIHPEHLSSVTSVKIIEGYDLILDCTDNPTSRYLISDAAVVAGRPLVSASALRTEGQLMVLNNPPNDRGKADRGPCYRCIFPKPPPAESVTACGEGGILGPVVGVMGVLMALEAIKMIARTSKGIERGVVSGLGSTTGDTPSMLLFSGYNSPPFRSVRLRGRRARCVACSDAPTITRETLASGSLDYAVLCGIKNQIALLDERERVNAGDVLKAKQNGNKFLILDVRDKIQFDICHIDGSINIPYSQIESTSRAREGRDGEDRSLIAIFDALLPVHTQTRDSSIYVLCRFGNDSQLAVRKLKELGFDNNGSRWIGDVKGGLQSWKRDVDPSWPEY